jgi:hypothetical protein
MPDQVPPCSYFDAEERRSRAIIAFLGAGMDDRPSQALCVRALADARRSLAVDRGRNTLTEQWLAAEIRFRGIKENAATLAVLEIPEHRQDTARSYASRHPDRLAFLDELLAVLE